MASLVNEGSMNTTPAEATAAEGLQVDVGRGRPDGRPPGRPPRSPGHSRSASPLGSPDSPGSPGSPDRSISRGRNRMSFEKALEQEREKSKQDEEERRKSNVPRLLSKGGKSQSFQLALEETRAKKERERISTAAAKLDEMKILRKDSRSVMEMNAELEARAKRTSKASVPVTPEEYYRLVMEQAAKAKKGQHAGDTSRFFRRALSKISTRQVGGADKGRDRLMTSPTSPHTSDEAPTSPKSDDEDGEVGVVSMEGKRRFLQGWADVQNANGGPVTQAAGLEVLHNLGVSAPGKGGETGEKEEWGQWDEALKQVVSRHEQQWGSWEEGNGDEDLRDNPAAKGLLRVCCGMAGW